jgi:hypothetical protein
MKNTLIAITLAVTAGSVGAECYSRSAAIRQLPVKIERATDFKRSVVPLPNNEFRCVVTFRVQIKGQWHTAEGISAGRENDSIDQVCANAISSGQAHILNSMGGSKLTMDQEMVCTDRPIPQVRAVKVGDVVLESEMAPHPNNTKLFSHQGSICKWFIETDARGSDIMQYQGIACRVRKGEWQVVDKW